jgi:hypothetical protein
MCFHSSFVAMEIFWAHLGSIIGTLVIFPYMKNNMVLCIWVLFCFLFLWHTCLNTNHQNIQKYEMLDCLSLHCSYGVNPTNVLVAMYFSTWTIVLITSTLRNFGQPLTCNMLHVASMTILLSCLMKPFCSWA